MSTNVGAAGGVTSARGPEELTTALEEFPPTEDEPPPVLLAPTLLEPPPTLVEPPPTDDDAPTLETVPVLEEPAALEEPTTPEEPPALLEVSTLEEDPTTPEEAPTLLEVSTLEDPTADDALPLEDPVTALDEPLAWDVPLDAPTEEEPTPDPPLLDPEARLEEPTTLEPPLLACPDEPPEDPPWLLPRDEDTSPLEPPVEEELDEELVSSVPVVGHPVQNATANSAVACPNRRIIMVPPKVARRSWRDPRDGLGQPTRIVTGEQPREARDPQPSFGGGGK